LATFNLEGLSSSFRYETHGVAADVMPRTLILEAGIREAHDHETTLGPATPLIAQAPKRHGELLRG
jgi:hypothetical protein